MAAAAAANAARMQMMKQMSSKKKATTKKGGESAAHRPALMLCTRWSSYLPLRDTWRTLSRPSCGVMVLVLVLLRTAQNDNVVPKGHARQQPSQLKLMCRFVTTGDVVSCIGKHHDHEHHDPHFPPGVSAGEWENDLHLFEAVSAQMECDADVVAKWSETMVAAWVASVCNNKFEGYSDNFLRHHVDGPILLQMHASHLEVSEKVPAVC